MKNAAVSHAVRLVASALLATFLAACGGGGSDNSTTPSPPAGNVGPAGATVASADGNATLDVPAGAVNSTINVTLTPATDGFMADPQIIPGTVFKLDSPEQALAQPATLSIAIPDSAFATANSGRKQAQAIVTAPGFLGCYLRTFTQGSSYSFFPTPLSPGFDLPPPDDPSSSAQAVCVYDAAFGCPTGFLQAESGLWNKPDYFTPQNPDTFPPGSDSGNGPIVVCEVAPLPQPLLVLLSPAVKAALLPGKYDKIKKKSSTSVTVLQPSLFASLFDKTPPVIEIQPTVAVVAPGMAVLTINTPATDNVGVTKVTLGTGDVLVDLSTHVATSIITPLAQFNAPPYVWTSAPMTFAQIFNHFYVYSASDAAGNKTQKAFFLQQLTPNITGFSASPANVPFGGGDVTLSWSIPGGAANGYQYPDTISIDNSVGDVTGLTSKTVHVTAPTTFKLTATNTAETISNTVTLTTTVTVGAEPGPTITSFTATPGTLPAGGGSVHLAWTTTNGDTLSISPNVGAVNGPNGGADVSITSSTTFVLSASNANGVAPPAQATVVVATTGDRFVDPAAGLDTNDCSQPAPCKTIAKAMSGAPGGSTVYLANGVYAPATQGNAATIPDGVGLKASNPGGASVVDGLVLTVAGSSAINGVAFDTTNINCGRVTASSTTGTPTLALIGVLLDCTDVLDISGSVSATLTPGTLINGQYTGATAFGTGTLVNVGGTAQLTIQGGIFDGNGQAANSAMLSVGGGASLTLSHVTVRNRKSTGIAVIGAATLVLNNQSLIDSVGQASNCVDASSVVIHGTGAVTLDHSTISNGASSAICVGSGTAASTVHIVQSTISKMANGLTAEIGNGSTAIVTMSGASFTNNARGIFWNGLAGTSFDISGSAFTGNTLTGIDFEGFGSLKLRNSTISSNSGQGVWLITNPSADLGTAADPGGNTLTGNTSTSVQMNFTNVGNVQAAGNTWNPNVQGADAAGHYATPTLKTGPAGSGTNYQITNASTLSL